MDHHRRTEMTVRAMRRLLAPTSVSQSQIQMQAAKSIPNRTNIIYKSWVIKLCLGSPSRCYR